MLRIYLFGLPRIEHDGVEIEITRRKAVALLAYLVATGKQYSRDALAAVLWPEDDASRARAELRRMLSLLNSTPLSDSLIVERQAVALRQSESIWVDVAAFETLLKGEPSPAQLREAVALYQDNFMAGFSVRDSVEFDDWQSFQLLHYQQMLIRALEKLVQHYTGLLETEQVIQLLHRLLAIDPHYEEAQRQLMRTYAATGQRAAALLQYEYFAQTLENDFGSVPQPETIELYERIKANESVQLIEQVAPVYANLPPVPSLVVGRETALAQIKRRIIAAGDTSQSTLLSIIQGWPGIGKSTITALLAHDEDIHQHFKDGVLWTSLGQTPNLFSELVTWAQALALPGLQSISAIEELSRRLSAALREKKMLVIVDDVWDAAHTLPFKVVGKHGCMLVTTRMNDVSQALAVKPDDIYKLPILDEKHGIALLQALAPAAVEQNPDDTRELVVNLEGLPLALQVAGRLLRAEMNMGWGIKQLLQELQEGARLLSAHAPIDRIDMTHETTPTVAALLQKSTDLLDDQTRERFALLGVFAPKPATFDLEAIRAVWAVDDARNTVRLLVERGLMEPAGNERFQIHALLVMHAKSMFGEPG